MHCGQVHVCTEHPLLHQPSLEPAALLIHIRGALPPPPPLPPPLAVRHCPEQLSPVAPRPPPPPPLRRISQQPRRHVPPQCAVAGNECAAVAAAAAAEQQQPDHLGEVQRDHPRRAAAPVGGGPGPAAETRVRARRPGQPLPRGQTSPAGDALGRLLPQQPAAPLGSRRTDPPPARTANIPQVDCCCSAPWLVCCLVLWCLLLLSLSLSLLVPAPVSRSWASVCPCAVRSVASTCSSLCSASRTN